MRNIFQARTLGLSLLALATTSVAADPPDPAAVLPVLRRVADWQIANPGRHATTDWTQGAMFTGLMALADLTGESKYRDALVQIAETNAWKPGRRRYHADDHVVGQTYLELYRDAQDPKMLGPIRDQFDAILASPATNAFGSGKKVGDRWWWCDALFMAPPALARLAYVTGEPKYLEFMNREWWDTTAYLYDQEEHLYFRDDRYFTQREANGRKIFWSRGNGWVMGGTVRVLQYLPLKHPDRPKYLQLFKDMAEAVRKAQQADGLWRASLLDPDAFPAKETSGSGFFTYALAWGINEGQLDRAAYEPVVRKAWAALVECVNPDGKLTHVQPIGADPKKFDPGHTDVYGVGAFLLAGTEMYRLDGGRPLPRAFARFVPERSDDFAWENDLVAFRAYGPALRPGAEDSGVDCWLKRVAHPVINRWYLGNYLGRSYHEDHGEGFDPYHVGRSRGVGGTALWVDGKLVISDTFRTWKVLANDPKEAVFELTYQYTLGGRTIDETRRFTIRPGEQLYRCEARFSEKGAPLKDLEVAIGVTTHDGKAAATLAKDRGWVACWEDVPKAGPLGTAAALAPGRITEVREVKSDKPDESHALLLARTDAEGRVAFAAGFAWARAGAIRTPEAWAAYLDEFVRTNLK